MVAPSPIPHEPIYPFPMRERPLRRTRSFVPRWHYRLSVLVATGVLILTSCQVDDRAESISIEDQQAPKPTNPTTDPMPTADAQTQTRSRESTIGTSSAPLPSVVPRQQIIRPVPTEKRSATPTPPAPPGPTPLSREDQLQAEVEVLPSSPRGVPNTSPKSPSAQSFVQSDGLLDEAGRDDELVDETATTSRTEVASSDEPEGDSDNAASESSSSKPDAVAVWTNNGYLLPAVVGKDDMWEVTTPCGNEVKLADATIAESPQVLLDPGHGGDETGSVTVGGIAEKDINLRVARRVRQHLEGASISVSMLRDNDTRITVPVRSAIANALEPDLFVSIHHNGGSTGESAEPPVEVFHQHDSGESKRMAGLLFEAIDAELSSFSYPWPANSFAGAQPRYNREGGDLYGVLRRTEVPAVLSEAFYLDGSTGDLIASNPQVLEAEAHAIASSIVRFLETDDFGSGFTKGQQMTLLAPNSGDGSGCVDPDLG